MTISEHTSTRHRLARAFVLGALVVLPIGFAGPALAEPLTLADNDNDWYRDCDHTGRSSWQQERGRWQNSDCDNNRGHWEQRDNDWRWHRDYDNNWNNNNNWNGNNWNGNQNRQQTPWWCQFGSC
ncbi:hypothetical protein [Nocardia tengchongensis]